MTFLHLAAAVPGLSSFPPPPPLKRALGVARPFPFKRSSQTLSHPRSADQRDCSSKVAVVGKGVTSTRVTDCGLPKPVFATMEEVCYAEELRLQLRARLLGDDAAVAESCSVGVH